MDKNQKRTSDVEEILDGVDVIEFDGTVIKRLAFIEYYLKSNGNVKFKKVENKLILGGE